jgi:hypothetical protein
MPPDGYTLLLVNSQNAINVAPSIDSPSGLKVGAGAIVATNNIIISSSSPTQQLPQVIHKNRPDLFRKTARLNLRLAPPCARRAYLQACFLGHGFQDVSEQILEHSSVVEVLIREPLERLVLQPGRNNKGSVKFADYFGLRYER